METLKELARRFLDLLIRLIELVEQAAGGDAYDPDEPSLAPDYPVKPRETPLPVELPPEPAPRPDPALELLTIAESFKGIDPTPKDDVDDEFACVDALTEILRMRYPNFPKLWYTPRLVDALKASPHFKPTLEVRPGFIIVNATESGNGTVIGHCGIIGRNGRIWSNNSNNGLWSDGFTLETWRERYRIRGGMPTLIFEPL